MLDRIRVAWLIARKDLRVELASRTAITAAIAFGILILVVFNFARDPATVTLEVLAPSVLWVTTALAGLVTLNRSFAMERESDAIEGLLLAPVSRSAIYLGKFLANLGFVLIVDLVVLPVFVLFFNLPLGGYLGWVALFLGLAAAGYVAVGTVLSAMTVRTRFAELMLPALLLVFVVPPVLGGVQATTRLLAGRPIGEILGWLWFLLAFDLVFLTLGLMLFPFTVDE